MKQSQHLSFTSPLLSLTVLLANTRHIPRLLMIGLVIVITFSSTLPTRAQDRPIAFASDSDLSATNKTEFHRVADLYKNETNAAQRKELRNQLISLTIAQTDLNFL